MWILVPNASGENRRPSWKVGGSSVGNQALILYIQFRPNLTQVLPAACDPITRGGTGRVFEKEKGEESSNLDTRSVRSYKNPDLRQQNLNWAVKAAAIACVAKGRRGHA